MAATAPGLMTVIQAERMGLGGGEAGSGNSHTKKAVSQNKLVGVSYWPELLTFDHL